MKKFWLKLLRYIARKLNEKDIIKNSDADNKVLLKVIEYCNHKLKELKK